MSKDKIDSKTESSDDGETVGRNEPKKSLEADYGDATPEQVALALLKYRPKLK